MIHKLQKYYQDEMDKISRERIKIFQSEIKNELSNILNFSQQRVGGVTFLNKKQKQVSWKDVPLDQKLKIVQERNEKIMNGKTNEIIDKRERWNIVRKDKAAY